MAKDRRILTTLFRHGPSLRMSFFADEVMLFMKSVESDLHLCMRMFELFGGASGPLVNKRKTAQIFRFDNFLKSQSSKGKIEFLDVLDFFRV
jgi:hypothetical protein